MTEKEIILTEEGYRKLKEELDYLTNTKRREVAERLKESIGFGDLSENSEYDDAKNEQAFVEGRIMQIQKILLKAKIIDHSVIGTSVVTVGSIVTLKDLETGEKFNYQVVGFAEADPGNQRISNESPVGKAILGRKSGEKVQVCVPEGILEYQILEINKKELKESEEPPVIGGETEV